MTLNACHLLHSAIIWGTILIWPFAYLVALPVPQSTSNGTIFEVEPRSLNVTEGDTVRYLCIPNLSSGLDFVSVTWKINGTLLNQLRERRNEFNGSSQSGGRNFLTTFASGQHNGIFVECLVFSTSDVYFSRKAFLYVQGRLGPVVNITTQLAEPSTLLLNWIAPFTLDISNTEIDMTFCVYAFNHSSQDLVHSVCGINETQYNITAEQIGARSPCDSFEFRVMAVNGAGNGSNGSYTLGYFYPSPLNFSSTEVLTDINVLSTSEMTVMFTIPFIHVCSCKIYLNPRQQSDMMFTLTPQDCSSNSLMVSLDREHQNDIYDVMIEVINAAGQAYTEGLLQISTHDVQGATANTSVHTEMFEIDLQFAQGSQARGALVVLSPVAQSQIMTYSVVRRSEEATHKLAYLTLPPSGVYDIFIYDIESSGLPQSLSLPAVVIEDFEITDGSAFVEVLASPNIHVSSGSQSVCIACSVSATSDALGCVAVVHSIEDLSNSSLLVKEIHKELLQPQCVEGLSEGGYSVAVFEWKSTGEMSNEPVTVTVVNVVILTTSWSTTATEQLIPSVETDNQQNFLITIASGSVGGLIILCVFGLVLICVGIIITRRNRKNPKLSSRGGDHGDEDEGSLQDFSVKEVPLNSNPAYGSVKMPQKGRRSTRGVVLPPKSNTDNHNYDTIQDIAAPVIYESIMD